MVDLWHAVVVRLSFKLGGRIFFFHNPCYGGFVLLNTTLYETHLELCELSLGLFHALFFLIFFFLET